ALQMRDVHRLKTPPNPVFTVKTAGYSAPAKVEGVPRGFTSGVGLGRPRTALDGASVTPSSLSQSRATCQVERACCAALGIDGAHRAA
ncbi:MAG: hypothetical protein M3348_18180, partial [Acidobacteriota bacterium]|nr:hypothetical protein [Acidobacteriota bacterium]